MVNSRIQRGQRLNLKDIVPSKKFQLGAYINNTDIVVDFSCFGLDASGKLSDDRYMTFFNQPLTPCGGVQIGNATGDSIVFSIDLEKIPFNINSLIITAAIDGNGSMSQLRDGYVRFILNDGQDITRFSFNGADFASEKALMLLEIYRKNDDWRVCATGQGFNGGLQALVKHFGGIVTAPVLAEASLVNDKSITPNQSTQKVVLKKQGDTAKISLTKNEEIIVTAQWIDNGDNNNNNDDLDLRAGILLPNGKMKIVHCGNKGALEIEPYVIHTGDVTSASKNKPAQEIMKVNPQIANQYGGSIAIVFSVYSAITNGVVSVASLKPVMRLQYQDQIIECELDFTKDKKALKKNVYTYVIGLVVIRGNEVEVMPSGIVSEPSSEATPWLRWDKTGKPQITMDGPAVTKGAGKLLAVLLNVGNVKKYE